MLDQMRRKHRIECAVRERQSRRIADMLRLGIRADIAAHRLRGERSQSGTRVEHTPFAEAHHRADLMAPHRIFAGRHALEILDDGGHYAVIPYCAYSALARSASSARLTCCTGRLPYIRCHCSSVTLSGRA